MAVKLDAPLERALRSRCASLGRPASAVIRDALKAIWHKPLRLHLQPTRWAAICLAAMLALKIWLVAWAAEGTSAAN